MIIANFVNLKRPETDNKGKLRQYTEMLGKNLYNNSTRETVTVITIIVMKEAMILNHSGEVFEAIKIQDFSKECPTTL